MRIRQSTGTAAVEVPLDARRREPQHAGARAAREGEGVGMAIEAGRAHAEPLRGLVYIQEVVNQRRRLRGAVVRGRQPSSEDALDHIEPRRLRAHRFEQRRQLFDRHLGGARRVGDEGREVRHADLFGFGRRPAFDRFATSSRRQAS